MPARIRVLLAAVIIALAAIGGAAFDVPSKTVFGMVRHPGATPAASFDQPATRWPPLLPPAVLATLRHGDDLALACLVVGGEACPDRLIAAWTGLRLDLINAYGPTEATVCAVMSARLDHAPAPIGRPLTSRRILRTSGVCRWAAWESFILPAPGWRWGICTGRR